jgi:hypothetical protein
MTKDELMKRLIRIEATPVKVSPPPRDVTRREFNTIDQEDQYQISEFDPIFDFEKEVEDLKPARDQAVEELAYEESKSIQNFLVLEEDNSQTKSGIEDSFFVFDDIETITTTNIEEEIPKIEKVVLSENIASGEEEVSLSLNKQLELEGSVNTFKFCKYVKENGEACKRQSPKNGDYCSSHRKVLAKQTE